MPATPVDVGTAVSNWRVSVNAVSAQRRAYVPGKYGSTRPQNQSATISTARQFINDRPKARAFYVSNTVPYISRLNDGSSVQAPAGFVETSLNAALRGIRTIKLTED